MAWDRESAWVLHRRILWGTPCRPRARVSVARESAERELGWPHASRSRTICVVTPTASLRTPSTGSALMASCGAPRDAEAVDRAPP